MIQPLSHRQWIVLRLIITATDATGEAPSIRAIARSLSVSHHAVQCHLEALHRKGWLESPSPSGMRCVAPSPPRP